MSNESNQPPHNSADASVLPSDSANQESWSALALSLQPVEPVPELRANLIARLAGPERFSLFALDVARVFGVAHEAARAALLRVDDPDVWQDGFAPGSRVFSTPALRDVSAVIARLPAASQIPQHPHAGRELTLVLQGCLIEDGHTQHGPGDVLDMPANSAHAVAVSSDADCLVVFCPMRL